MGLDINNIVITNPNTDLRLRILLPSGQSMSITNTGNVLTSAEIYFYTYINSGWNTYTSSVYQKMPFDTVLRQAGGSNFSTANNRYTVPKTGMYLFLAGCYSSYSGAQGAYVHPLFYVNGSKTARRDNGTNVLPDIDYRIRHYGMSNPSGYGVTTGPNSVDTYISQLLYLLEGDYIESWHYSTASNQYYGYHSVFSGIYTGVY